VQTFPLLDSPTHPLTRAAGAPIFISGCNRGGTTILSRLLAAHPQCCNIGRGDFNEGLYIWRRRFPDRSRHRWAVWPWRVFIRKTEAAATPETVRFFRDAFDRASGPHGRLLEKTPANAVRVPFIDRLYPDCHFVHVLRDGRHTTASLIARRVWAGYAPHQWVGAHRTALADFRRLPETRVTLVRYEELLTEPERVLGRVAERCELDWDRTGRSAVLAAAHTLIRPPDDRWPRLSRSTRSYVLSVIAPLQRELGYPIE